MGEIPQVSAVQQPWCNQFCLQHLVPPRRWRALTSNQVEPNLGHPNVNTAISVLYPNLRLTTNSGRQTTFLFSFRRINL